MVEMGKRKDPPPQLYFQINKICPNLSMFVYSVLQATFSFAASVSSPVALPGHEYTHTEFMIKLFILPLIFN